MFQVRGFEEKEVPADANGVARTYWTKSELRVQQLLK